MLVVLINSLFGYKHGIFRYKKGNKVHTNIRSSKAVTNFKFLIFLVMLYAVAVVASIATGYKIVKIGSFMSTGGTFIYPLTFTVGDIVAEIYGYSYARKMIWASIVCDYVFATAVTAIVRLPSPHHWHEYQAYEEVFGHTLRFVFAGTVAVLIGSFVNVYVLSKWKVLMNGRFFILRSIGSTAIGEAALNTVGIAIGFWGVEPPSELFDMAISMYLFMLAYAAVSSLPASLVVRWLRRSEGIDIYDCLINYNPFKLSKG